MGNNLTIIDLVEKTPQELVAQQSTEQKCQTYIALDILTKALKDIEKEEILKSGINKYEWTLPNGTKKTLNVVKTDGRVEDIVVKTIDMVAVEKFAKENGYELPMTKPQIDSAKLENLEWFQNNVEKFVKKEIQQKQVKPTNSLRVK